MPRILILLAVLLLPLPSRAQTRMPARQVSVDDSYWTYLAPTAQTAQATFDWLDGDGAALSAVVATNAYVADLNNLVLSNDLTYLEHYLEGGSGYRVAISNAAIVTNSAYEYFVDIGWGTNTTADSFTNAALLPAIRTNAIFQAENAKIANWNKFLTAFTFWAITNAAEIDIQGQIPNDWTNWLSESGLGTNNFPIGSFVDQTAFTVPIPGFDGFTFPTNFQFQSALRTDLGLNTTNINITSNFVDEATGYNKFTSAFSATAPTTSVVRSANQWYDALNYNEPSGSFTGNFDRATGEFTFPYTASYYVDASVWFAYWTDTNGVQGYVRAAYKSPGATSFHTTVLGDYSPAKQTSDHNTIMNYLSFQKVVNAESGTVVKLQYRSNTDSASVTSNNWFAGPVLTVHMLRPLPETTTAPDVEDPTLP